MDKCSEVVTSPLGLAGFVLFLMFSFLARTIRQSELAWSPSAFAMMAVIALVGGISLAFFQADCRPGLHIERPERRGHFLFLIQGKGCAVELLDHLVTVLPTGALLTFAFHPTGIKKASSSVWLTFEQLAA